MTDQPYYVNKDLAEDAAVANNNKNNLFVTKSTQMTNSGNSSSEIKIVGMDNTRTALPVSKQQ